MANSPVIEKLSEKNFNNFIQLMERLANYEKLELLGKKAKTRLKKDGLRGNPKYEAFLIKLNNKFVGYAVFYMTYSTFLALPTLFLEDLFVLKEYRKNRIGQKMLDFCIRKAKERKCGRIDLSILDWNKPSINFFKKNNALRLNWLHYRIGLN